MRRARLGLSQLCAVEFHPVDHALFRSACHPPMTQRDTAVAKHCVPHAPSTLSANEMEQLRGSGHNNPWIVCITVCPHVVAAVGSSSSGQHVTSSNSSGGSPSMWELGSSFCAGISQLRHVGAAASDRHGSVNVQTVCQGDFCELVFVAMTRLIFPGLGHNKG